MQAQLGDPALYAASEGGVTALAARMAELDAEISTAMARWEELETRAAGR